jgi:hypothetical protein
MKKFTFTVELIGNDVDSNTIGAMLAQAVDGVATYQCVEHTDTKALSEQGLKVWTKRKIGLSLATPKPVKAAKPTETAETESEELVEAGA